MNRHAKKWIKALRSGRYTQANGFLHYGKDFCCLGVACDLYMQKADAEWITDSDSNSDVFDFYSSINSSSYFLPQEVQDWLGIRHSELSTEFIDNLAHMNDSGANFLEIADVIEQNLDKIA